VGRAGAISEALVFLMSAKLLEERGYSLGIRTSAPSQRGEAKKADAEQHDRRRLAYRPFGDHDLTVARPEISSQDLVCARIERAAATTGRTFAEAAEAAAAAAVAAATTSADGGAPAAAETPAVNPAGELWKRTTTSARTVVTGTEKPTTATATTTGDRAPAAAVAAGAAIGNAINNCTGTAVRPGETALAGEGGVQDTASTSSGPGDDQRRVSRADYETPTASASAHTRAANGDLQRLPCGQAEVAADLCALTAGGEITE
jgi:hypothetical protein